MKNKPKILDICDPKNQERFDCPLKRKSFKFPCRIFYAIVLIAITGCNSEETEYKLLSGDISGIVYQNGLVKEDPVQVILEGNNVKKTTTTNEQSQYIFKGLKTGTYNLTFIKEGFGTCFLNGYSYIGGTKDPVEVPDINLAQLPDASVSNLTISKIESYTEGVSTKTVIYYNAEFASDPNLRTYYIYYISTDQDASYRNYDIWYWLDETSPQIFLSEYYHYLKEKGTKLYLIIYPLHYDWATKYTDSQTGCEIHPGVQVNGASNIASIKIN